MSEEKSEITELDNKPLELPCPICAHKILENKDFKFICETCHGEFTRSSMRAYWQGYKDGKGWKHEGQFKKELVDPETISTEEIWDEKRLQELWDEADKMAGDIMKKGEMV